jgi:small GTP-binding protein
MTIGVNFEVKRLSVGGEPVSLVIWDLGGSPHFRDVCMCCYTCDSFFIYVFDVANRESFRSLDMWRAEVAEKCKDASGVIVGNKVDLSSREVKRGEGERYAEGVGMPYFETSAVTGENVKKVFRTAARFAFKK